MQEDIKKIAKKSVLHEKRLLICKRCLKMTEGSSKMKDFLQNGDRAGGMRT